jgi:ATP-dependent protease HslVU (ClpYQ) ATPase subunit
MPDIEVIGEISRDKKIQYAIQMSLEEAHRSKELRCIEKIEIEEHHLEDLKHMMHEEALHDLGCEIEIKDQVSTFLHCRLRFINDLDVTKKLTQMLSTCMEEKEMERTISAPHTGNKYVLGQ